MTYDRKTNSIGTIEICDSDVKGWYALVVNGVIKEQSPDFNYIKSVFNKY